MSGSRFFKRVKRINPKFLHAVEPQEIFLDKLAQKKEEEFGFSEKKFEVPLPGRLIRGFFLFIILLFALFIWRTVHFQVFDKKSLVALAERNKFAFFSVQADRGVIYDSAGKQLVFNKASFDLFLLKSQIPKESVERELLLEEISKIVNENRDKIEEKIAKSSSDNVLIAENLEHSTLVLAESRIQETPALYIARRSERQYPEPGAISHIIGYTGRIAPEELSAFPDYYSPTDYVGRSGLEKSYEDVLRKNPGKLRIEKDAVGNEISKEVISLPSSGNSLVLWLELDLQKKIQEALERTLSNTGAKKAAAVAINPKTGGIMSLVSLPTFDNNAFTQGADPETLKNTLSDPLEPLFNRAISGYYPTGSTIKPLIAAAALQEKIISPEKEIYSPGYLEVPHQYDPDIVYVYRDNAVHGWADMRKAIAQSVNVYFYTIGGGYKEQAGLGPSRIKKYLNLFGWGQATGIDLPGENPGFIPSPEWKREQKGEVWLDGDTYNLSIGQGDILITPLQVATSFAAIANGGTLYKPKAAKAIRLGDGELLPIEPEALRENFIDAENLNIVRGGMRQAVTGQDSPLASSVILNSLPVKAAAKTGTAQTSRENYYNNWITVFAPYDDPQIVLTIMVENIKNVQAAANPAAREVLDWYFSR